MILIQMLMLLAFTGENVSRSFNNESVQFIFSELNGSDMRNGWTPQVLRYVTQEAAAILDQRIASQHAKEGNYFKYT